MHYVSCILQPYDIPNIEWTGHLDKDSWEALLKSSKFLLGMGDPLLGPSVIDAIGSGCMYINPIYQTPFIRVQTGISYHSQHPYAEKIAKNDPELSTYICSFDINNREELKTCVKRALTSNLPAIIPKDFTASSYLNRVKTIFSL